MTISLEATDDQKSLIRSIHNWTPALVRKYEGAAYRYMAELAAALESAVGNAEVVAADAWDECLDAIEGYELNTEQARAGNPYRNAGVDRG